MSAARGLTPASAPERSLAARLYRALLGLFPKSVPAEDRHEIAGTFAALYGDARSTRRRLRVLALSFGRLPGVILLEWRDHLRPRRTQSRRSGERMHGLWSAVRHGGRSLAKSPSFTWSAVLLLGLGVGAVTTIFSVVDHVVLRPLPYPESDRLVKIQNGSHSGPTFERLAEMGTIEQWAGVSTADANLTGEEEPVRLREAEVTRDFFTMFGARPAAGRLFVASDFEARDGIVMSHGTWRRVFGEDLSVVGRTLRIDGEPRVVLGVVDASFVAPEALDGGDADVWRPIDWSRERYRHDNYSVLSVAGRLAPGVTVAQAQAEADALAARRAEEVPARFRQEDGTPQPLPVVSLQDDTVGMVRAGLGLIFGAVTLLLLVACVNVAHLFMARGVERTREMSVRRALGARTSALARQLAVESMMIGLAGAVVGVVIAVAGIGAFRAFGPQSLPRMSAIAVDARVLAFAAVVGLATSLLFGLLPALRLALRGGDNPLHLAGKGSTPTRGTNAMRHGLVVAEVALSLVLAAQAGWLIRSFTEMHTVELGFRTANVWTLPLTPTDIETPAEWKQRMQGIRESLAAVPGVRAASFGLTMPLQYVGGNHCCWRSNLRRIGDDTPHQATIHPVDADYFELFELRAKAGRTWSRSDEASAAAAATLPIVLLEPFAVEVFGSAGDAIGRQMSLSGKTYEVVGVLPSNRHYGPDREHTHGVYIPAGALTFVPSGTHMAVLTSGPQTGLPRALTAAVWRAEPGLPVPTVRSMDDWAAVATARARFVSGLFTAFGGVALLLVAGGLAGTLLYTVRVRRRELGIRLALGASPMRIQHSVLRRGLALALIGAAIGSLGVWMSARVLESLAAGMAARDGGTFGIAVAVLLGVALVSSWMPARWAAATDPMETLRAE